MTVIPLSTNGFHITDVFNTELFQEIYDLNLTFTPTSTRPTPKSLREVYDIGTADKLRKEISSVVLPMLTQISKCQWIRGIELWRDYAGYENAYHLDDPLIDNVMIVYLDNVYSGMGTGYIENGKHYQVDYQANTAIALLNSNQIEHGMTGTVPSNTVRRTLYINWR